MDCGINMKTRRR